MDVSSESTKPNPREKANFLSVLFFGYTLSLFKKGYTKDLEFSDLYKPLRRDVSKVLGDRLEKKWNESLAATKNQKKKPNLLRTLIATFWLEYFSLGVLLVVIEIGLRLSQPYLLKNLLDYFKPDRTMSKTDALLYAAGVGGIDVFVAILMNQYVMNASHYGMKIRIACCSLIYRKSLKLSTSALEDSASGKIVNLLSNDVNRFDYMSILINYMWTAPTVAIIVTYLMYRECGYAAVIGMLPFLVAIPIQGYIGKISAIYRKQTALRTDERIRLIDEIISGIQVIKMYAWEIPFSKLVRWARENELNILVKSSYVRGVFMSFRLFTIRMALFCTLLTMVLNGQEISAAQVFVFTLFFNQLSYSMGTMFVRVIQEFAEFLVSIKRIEQFLLSDEYVETIQKNQTSDVPNNTNDDNAVTFKGASAKWDVSKTDCVLSNIDLKLEKDKLYGIIGPVGGGKSSLLQSILGELHITNGNVNVNGTISYASQEPWIFTGTIRQNILFGETYDEVRYKKVVEVCALKRDFELFVDGDLTLVGDRGSSLSGGQKARVNLARAVYREADIYLLDDPLSAVDINVAKHLIKKCLQGYLGKKTRIMVTHQIHLLTTVDQIILLNEGKIENQGTFEEISSSENTYIKEVIKESKLAKQKSTETENEDSTHEEKSLDTNSLTSRTTIQQEEQENINHNETDNKIPNSDKQNAQNHQKSKTKDERIAPAQEESSKGKVKGSLFLKYCFSGQTICFPLFVFSLYLLTQASASGADYFIGFWTNNEDAKTSTKITYDDHWSTDICLIVYGSLVLFLFVVALMRSFLFYKMGKICSAKLHDNLFKKVLYATMQFFNTNPSGRIINRFSKDMGGIDEYLPKAILDASQIILQMIGALLLIVCVNPWFILFVAILCVIFWFLRKVFLKTSKNIKRLEGILKAPMFTHLKTTIQGLATVRAFGAQNMLKDEFDKLQNNHTSAWFMYIMAQSAFAFCSDFLSSLFTVAITFSFLLFATGLLAGEVGLAITQAIALTSLIQWGMKQSAEIVNHLISVERVLEYDSLAPEKQPEKPSKIPPEWPSEGEINFRDMSLKYDEAGPLILKDFNIVIKPKEKIGIVGRTGAGKSSMISALFRLADVDGDIIIDDINTKDIILQELRSKISIIPQDPVLFSGTLRYNLDPFEEYPDSELYKAINEVELKDPNNVINRLENRVLSRGANYSVGQRQLICLARAMVRNNKILMLDEATANVDPQTDALIQKTLREKFADCTILTVAHRLNTIMDSDKVMVLEAGEIFEFDHPHILLQKEDGQFHNMVKKTGTAMSNQLTSIANQHYEQKQYSRL